MGNKIKLHGTSERTLDLYLRRCDSDLGSVSTLCPVVGVVWFKVVCPSTVCGDLCLNVVKSTKSGQFTRRTEEMLEEQQRADFTQHTSTGSEEHEDGRFPSLNISITGKLFLEE